MSKHYEAVWGIIESLDEINGKLSDMLDEEQDRKAKPHLREAMSRIEEAVAELESIDPDERDDGIPPSGTIIIGKFI